MARRRSATLVVPDATVLIHLARAGCFAALGAIEHCDFVVPEQVVEDVTYPEQAALLRVALEPGHLRIERSTDPAELTLYAKVRQRMGRGEAASLAVAVCRSSELASDDRGRVFCRLVRELLGEEKIVDTMALVRPARDGGVLTPDEVAQIRRVVEG